MRGESDEERYEKGKDLRGEGEMNRSRFAFGAFNDTIVLLYIHRSGVSELGFRPQ